MMELSDCGVRATHLLRVIYEIHTPVIDELTNREWRNYVLFEGRVICTRYYGYEEVENFRVVVRVEVPGM